MCRTGHQNFPPLHSLDRWIIRNKLNTSNLFYNTLFLFNGSIILASSSCSLTSHLSSNSGFSTAAASCILVWYQYELWNNPGRHYFCNKPRFTAHHPLCVWHVAGWAAVPQLWGRFLCFIHSVHWNHRSDCLAAIFRCVPNVVRENQTEQH